MAKFRQLQQLKLLQTKITVRYWNDSQTYDQFSTILLSQHQEYIDTWAEEHCLTQRWQPKLSYPCYERAREERACYEKTTTSLQASARHPRQAQHPTQAGAILEALLCHLQWHKAGVRCTPRAWQRQTRPRFSDNTLQIGQSHENRFGNHMEKFWRSKARSRLRLVLKFRHASIPSTSKISKFRFSRRHLSL